MNNKGFTTESGGRQNGFSLEPEINIVSENESKKSIIVFFILTLAFLGSLMYFVSH